MNFRSGIYRVSIKVLMHFMHAMNRNFFLYIVKFSIDNFIGVSSVIDHWIPISQKDGLGEEVQFLGCLDNVIQRHWTFSFAKNIIFYRKVPNIVGLNTRIITAVAAVDNDMAFPSLSWNALPSLYYSFEECGHFLTRAMNIPFKYDIN